MDSMQACNDPLKDMLYITGKFIYKASIVYKPDRWRWSVWSKKSSTSGQ